MKHSSILMDFIHKVFMKQGDHDQDRGTIGKYIEDKRVLVTGGGGFIGSELCRQVAGLHPKELVILDIYENGVHDLQDELNRKYNKHDKNALEDQLNVDIVIASVRDVQRMDAIMEEKKPDVIFHAAASKNMLLMESNPSEAIENNIFGTYNVAKAADAHDVGKFVLISTDKAVHPTSVMGATKRFSEMIIQSFSKVSDTAYTAVRFGDVVSGIGKTTAPRKGLFAKRGPEAVVGDYTRYSITRAEAVQMVLQATGIAESGEIFEFDMDGFAGSVDMTGSNKADTRNDRIFIDRSIEVEHEDIMKRIQTLQQSVYEGELELIIDELKKSVIREGEVWSNE